MADGDCAAIFSTLKEVTLSQVKHNVSMKCLQYRKNYNIIY